MRKGGRETARKVVIAPYEEAALIGEEWRSSAVSWGSGLATPLSSLTA